MPGDLPSETRLAPSDPPRNPPGRAVIPEEYPSFGAPVYSMAPGVITVGNRSRDHRARNTWQGLVYMLTLEGAIRSVAGHSALLGNHVIIRHDDGTAAVYAHLLSAHPSHR